MIPNSQIVEERVVESKDWSQSDGVLKRMCCTDAPLTTVPPAEFQPKKLRSDSLLGKEVSRTILSMC